MSEPWLKVNGGCLDPEKHAYLIKHRVNCAADACVPLDYLWTPFSKLVPGAEKELDWFKTYPRNRSLGWSGLLLLGVSPSPPPIVRFSALAAALLRFNVRSRVVSLYDVVGSVLENNETETSCLLIPDFADGVSKRDQRWRSALTAILQRRWSDSSKQTVVYAPSIEAIGSEWGPFLKNFVASTFLMVDVDA